MVGEIAFGHLGDVEQDVFGEPAAVVPRQGVHASLQRMQGADDGAHDRDDLAVAHTVRAQQAGLAIDSRDHPRESLAYDGVAFQSPTRLRLTTMAGRSAVRCPRKC